MIAGQSGASGREIRRPARCRYSLKKRSPSFDCARIMQSSYTSGIRHPRLGDHGKTALRSTLYVESIA